MRKSEGRTAQRIVNWKSVILAGLLGGAAFLIVNLPLNVIIYGRSPWVPVRMIGAILLGRGALPPPPTFDIGILLVAVILHFGLSILYTLTGAIIARPDRLAAVVTGAVLGVLLYLINFYIFTGLFPWFEGARNWLSIVTHVVFGAVASLTYLHLRNTKGPV